MTKFAQRLKELRTERQVTQKELGDTLRLCKNSISMYEHGEREPGLERLEAIADFFNVDLDYLLGKSDIPNRAIAAAQIPPIGEPLPPMHKIPILGTISAGLPLYAEQNIEGYTYTEHNGGAEYFALYAKGDSMTAAHINEGDILVIRRQEKVENGEIAVVRVNDDTATVKRFKQDGNIVQLIPQSYNPVHQIQIYDLKKENINIVGKVVECKIIF